MKRILLSVVVILAMTLFAPSAYASVRGDLSFAAKQARVKVIKRYGVQAAGRDIVKYGVVFVTADHREAARRPKLRELRAYSSQLRRLVAPAVYYRTTAVAPSQAPAGTLTAAHQPTGLAGCIVQAESGGDPTAVNGQYHGIAQWSAEAWARHGGHKYASDPLGATYDQQVEILANGLSKFGCRDWCPFDPC